MGKEGRSREPWVEAALTSQPRDDDGSAQGGGSGGGITSECILKTEPIEFAEGLAMGCVRDGGDNKIFDQSSWKDRAAMH